MQNNLNTDCTFHSIWCSMLICDLICLLLWLLKLNGIGLRFDKYRLRVLINSCTLLYWIIYSKTVETEERRRIGKKCCLDRTWRVSTLFHNCFWEQYFNFVFSFDKFWNRMTVSGIELGTFRLVQWSSLDVRYQGTSTGSYQNIFIIFFVSSLKFRHFNTNYIT